MNLDGERVIFSFTQDYLKLSISLNDEGRQQTEVELGKTI